MKGRKREGERDSVCVWVRERGRYVYFIGVRIVSILQLTEALSYLHYSGHVIHRNVCPSSILITKRGIWKLAGMEYVGECIYHIQIVYGNQQEN